MNNKEMTNREKIAIVRLRSLDVPTEAITYAFGITSSQVAAYGAWHTMSKNRKSSSKRSYKHNSHKTAKTSKRASR